MISELRLNISIVQMNNLCELVREIMKDDIENYTCRTGYFTGNDLITRDGAFHTWAEEILDVIGVSKC